MTKCQAQQWLCAAAEPITGLADEAGPPMTHLAGVTRAGTGWATGYRAGTWRPGTSGNDDALDRLDSLAGNHAGSRRQDPERIFRSAREHPDDLNRTPGPPEILAAAAVVAAGLPGGETVAGDHQILRHRERDPGRRPGADRRRNRRAADHSRAPRRMAAGLDPLPQRHSEPAGRLTSSP